MPNRVLPAHPNLEQYKKQAKDLVTDRAKASPDAFARIRHSHPRLRELADVDIQSASFKLSDAQFIIAREHAFDSWPKFARHVQTLQADSAPATKADDKHPGHPMAQIPVDGIELTAEITVPDNARGVVLFTNASGSSRYHPRNRSVAALLNRASFATVQTDLLTEDEELADLDRNELALNLRLLGRRIAAITDWIGGHSQLKGLGLGYLGSGTGAAAALFAASERPDLVKAIVSSGGRPDLAGPYIWKVRAATLLIVGGRDRVAVGLHLSAITWFRQKDSEQDRRKLEIIEGTTQRFESEDAFDECAGIALEWFEQHLPAQLEVSR